MAAEVDTTAIEAEIDNDKRLNKTEKKARKALAKLGLKPVPNVARVTMKKQPSILFLIAEPEVYKSPAGAGQETYVIYGQCQIDDGTQRRFAPQQKYADFTPTPSAGAEEEDEEMPEMTPAEAAGESGDVSAEGLQEKDIEMVMTQAGVDRKKAIAALKKNGGDIVNSIMDLTM
jgi:nascent polypeptide-associated complex subunit alpha